MSDPPTDYAALVYEALTWVSHSDRRIAAQNALASLEAELAAALHNLDECQEENWPWEWVIATAERERRKAAEAELAEAREKAAKLARLIVEQEREYAAERKQSKDRAERAKADYTALARQLTDCQEQLRHCAAELAEARRGRTAAQDSCNFQEARAVQAKAALREWRERAATLASAVGVARLHLAAGRPIEALGALDGAAAKTRAALAAGEAETERGGDPNTCANCGHSRELHFRANAYVPGKCDFQYDLCGCRNFVPASGLSASGETE